MGALPLLWGRLQDALANRFSSPRSENRDRLVLLLLTTVILTILIIPEQHILKTRYKAGEIATADVRANRDYLVEDRKLTEEKQAEAAAAVPVIYDLDKGVADSILHRLRRGLAFLATARNGSSDREQLRRGLSDIIGGEVTLQELGALLRVNDEKRFLADMGRVLQQVYRQQVIVDQSSFTADRINGIALRGAKGESLPEGTLPSDPIELEQARKFLLSMKNDTFAGTGGGSIRGLVGRMLRPSLVFNHDRTEEKRGVARHAVNPVLIQIKRGEMIARDGDRITAEQEMKLSWIASETSLAGRISMGTGVMGIVLVLLYFPYRFARKNIRKFSPTYKDLFLLAILTIIHFFLLKMLYSITTPLGGAFPYVDTSNYIFLFPFATSAIMVRIFINSEVALVHAAICAPLAGLLYNSLPVVFYSLLGSIIGAHGVRHCDRRGTVFNAGLKVSVVNLAMVVAFQLFHESIISMQTVYCMAFAVAGGLVTAVLASGGIPFLESLFQYTTDIKLLELTNLNSPVLRELMVRAPGTYHHSVVVGNLVEAAAEAINANPLLARVAAYYHDIGKISKPQYFIENQAGGENRHDKLSPSMSALILISHVKEGGELARQHRLGQPIAEIIRQSHGTALIKFFHQKAQEQATPDQVVDEHDFRYPGPKPQTREAGLVLLADAVEAASRTLVDPNPARIQGLVQKIINNIFIDGQLDECELTLKNLHEIAWSFNQILTGIYHQRIDYPQPAYKEKIVGGRRHSEYSDSEPAKTDEGRDEVPKGSGGEDLKRLGMSH
ncbi:MAG TPA: HDIG domain-containing protein [Geobacteraceae bacterium]|nr:HDIG domain-containing protein [Geobacteraceae bacterium]